MRIISNFHDYYDSVQAHGQDHALIYHRVPYTVNFGREDFPFEDNDTFGQGWYYEPPYFSAIKYYIGFCGKVYPMIKIILQCDMNKYFYCHTIEDIDDIIQTYFKPKIVESFIHYDGKKSRRMGRREKFCQFFNKPKIGYEYLFREENVPIFVARKVNSTGSIEYNGNLKQYMFYRVVDTFQAFQRISMYVGGVLSSRREYVPPVPDKILAEAKGFDKYSFRKDKKK